MEIIKKYDKRSAWVRTGETTAQLLTYDKDKTDAEMIADGVKIKAKNDRLAEIAKRIEELNG